MHDLPKEEQLPKDRNNESVQDHEQPNNAIDELTMLHVFFLNNSLNFLDHGYQFLIVQVVHLVAHDNDRYIGFLIRELRSDQLEQGRMFLDILEYIKHKDDTIERGPIGVQVVPLLALPVRTVHTRYVHPDEISIRSHVAKGPRSVGHPTSFREFHVMLDELVERIRMGGSYQHIRSEAVVEVFVEDRRRCIILST
jgi:hypothetical protein